jgi:hypothetical protein
MFPLPRCDNPPRENCCSHRAWRSGDGLRVPRSDAYYRMKRKASVERTCTARLITESFALHAEQRRVRLILVSTGLCVPRQISLTIVR